MMAEDIVQKAEKVILSLKEKNERGYNNMITTSQIRKFLTAVNAVTNRVEVFKVRCNECENLSEELINEIKFLKVKLVYQVGKDKKLRPFVENAELLEMIDGIGSSIRKYENFARYMEALVAYHKYYGGKD